MTSSLAITGKALVANKARLLQVLPLLDRSTEGTLRGTNAEADRNAKVKTIMVVVVDLIKSFMLLLLLLQLVGIMAKVCNNLSILVKSEVALHVRVVHECTL